MRLTDLDPHWVGAGGEGISRRLPDGSSEPVPRRDGIGIIFNCPCGNHGETHRAFIPFSNPLDGGPPHVSERPQWRRTGDTFETLTLSPSICRIDCRWHGWVQKGEVTQV